MIRDISTTLKQALRSNGFIAALVGAILVMLFASFESILTAFSSTKLLEFGFHDALIASAVTSNAMTLALPILASLPFTSSFVDDIKSGFIKAYLPRTSTARYLTSKCTVCAVSGGLALAISTLAMYLVSTLLFLPKEAALPEGMTAPDSFSMILERVLLMFCSGAFWSLVGLTFATLTNSKYMAYASPFTIYYLLIILYERYFDTMYVLYPKEWLNPSSAWMWGSTGVIIMLLEFTVVMCLIFCVAAKRRISQI